MSGRETEYESGLKPYIPWCVRTVGRQSKKCWVDTQLCDWRRERNIRAHDVQQSCCRHSALGCTASLPVL